ncbi:MAG: hypothetical protein AVDCRST_MAG19-462 [uncultured Thermomicrobiales bacterium]|uniref:Helix-turn-helix domain-containing protein n=1 Tax=uncultured Thermomicrobiales bacterium TaxID=1645740 RepID=A0A6J4UG46_9BACT|nr:MAG: hypothetical protein AVDCRST_MAG19-462 [uncultured Thermomicrobiales bacterium]
MADHAGEQLLTVADVAGRIGAHEKTVRGWIRAGELKAIRFDSRIGYRVKRADFDRFLDRRSLAGAVSRQLLAAAISDPTGPDAGADG